MFLFLLYCIFLSFIIFFFLFSNKSETLPFESNFNITTVAVSPNGYTLIVVNEGEYAHII